MHVKWPPSYMAEALTRRKAMRCDWARASMDLSCWYCGNTSTSTSTFNLPFSLSIAVTSLYASLLAVLLVPVWPCVVGRTSPDAVEHPHQPIVWAYVTLLVVPWCLYDPVLWVALKVVVECCVSCLLDIPKGGAQEDAGDFLGHKVILLVCPFVVFSM